MKIILPCPLFCTSTTIIKEKVYFKMSFIILSEDTVHQGKKLNNMCRYFKTT